MSSIICTAFIPDKGMIQDTQDQGYMPARLVSGISTCVAFFKYKDNIVTAVVPAGGQAMLADLLTTVLGDHY